MSWDIKIFSFDSLDAWTMPSPTFLTSHVCGAVFLQEVLVEEEGGFLQEGAISVMTVSGAVEIMVAGAMEEMILETGVITQVELVVISGLIKTGRAEVDVLVGLARQVWIAKLRCDS